MHAFLMNEDASVAVDLHDDVRDFVRQCADFVIATRSATDSPAHQRVYGPINVELDDDDIFATLEREMKVDALCELVSSSADKSVLSEEEADAWLKVLSMTCSGLAANFGIGDESDLDRLDWVEEQQLRLVQALQWSLVSAMLDE